MSTGEMSPREISWEIFRREKEKSLDFSNLYDTNESYSVGRNTISPKSICKCVQVFLLITKYIGNIYIYIFFLKQVLTLLPGLGCSAVIIAHCHF